MPEDIMIYDNDEPMEELEEPGDLSVFEDFFDDLQKGNNPDDSSNPEPPTNSDPDEDVPF